jgi:hypothetical protein
LNKLVFLHVAITLLCNEIYPKALQISYIQNNTFLGQAFAILALPLFQNHERIPDLTQFPSETQKGENWLSPSQDCIVDTGGFKSFRFHVVSSFDSMRH